MIGENFCFLEKEVYCLKVFYNMQKDKKSDEREVSLYCTREIQFFPRAAFLSQTRVCFTKLPRGGPKRLKTTGRKAIPCNAPVITIVKYIRKNNKFGTTLMEEKVQNSHSHKFR